MRERDNGERETMVRERERDKGESKRDKGERETRVRERDKGERERQW